MKKQLPLIRDRITFNWLYKLVAFFVAATIWIATLHGRKDAVLLRNVDIEVSVARGFVVTDLADRTVKVKVAGPRTSLNRYRQVAQPIRVDLTGVQAGTHQVVLHPEDVPLPVGVELIKIEPSEILLTVKEVK